MKKIKPSEEEEKKIIDLSKDILERVRREIEKKKVNADPVLVGSVAKGTFLKDPDIDIFIRFAPSYSREEMEKTGLEIAKSVMPNGVASYAEHPYLRGKIEGFRVDIVPCYRVENPEGKMSSVDRTPFHTEYVSKHLPEEKRDDVRLLKAFMKGIGVYGAEAKVQGFSGYLCELLIIKYGSFIETLKNAAMWKKRVYLDLGNGGKKFRSPVVFVDPVDSNRNVASAVSEESKSVFILASREFIKNPRMEFFFRREIMVMSAEELKERLRERGTKFYAIIFKKPGLIDDVLYPQIRRTLVAFKAVLKDFIPVSEFYYVHSNTVVFIMEFERDILPEVEVHEGPPVWHNNAEKFVEKWKNNALRGPYVKDHRLYVDRKRKWKTLKEVLVESLKNYKLGKYFEEHKHEMIVLRVEENIDKLSREKLTEFLDFRFPWEL